ncbi:hypothetical protein QN277_022966 [Acacia crassicarpa]|uniref:Uncharacterized protein n=1 Tax=Acacia crassicarpa TaxID=499986 RepID=A0AAE1JGC4_9FABA|nr:hypothetical protein QN277_022966 [Acacia crassicarpa]
MKPSSFALFFLFAIIASSAKAQFVLDVKGNIVVNGGTYYIIPYIWALGGGLGLAKTGNEACPLSVVQSPAEVDNGLPWTIMSPLRILHITTNTRLDFFAVKGKVPSCVPVPSKWTIVEGDDGISCVPVPSKWTIVEGDDGIKYVKIRGFKNTLQGWFKIQKYNSIAYKIVFCPVNGDSCRNLGISRDEHGKRFLVITDDPLVVIFVKVESSEVSEQVIKNVVEA